MPDTKWERPEFVNDIMAELDDATYTNRQGNQVQLVEPIKARGATEEYTRILDRDFYKLIHILSDGALKLFFCLAEKMDYRTNYYSGTYDEISQRLSVGRTSVTDHMVELQSADAIRMIRRGEWMLNPNIIVKRKDLDQRQMIAEYKTYRSPEELSFTKKERKKKDVS